MSKRVTTDDQGSGTGKTGKPRDTTTSRRKHSAEDTPSVNASFQGSGADAVRSYLRDIGKVKLLDTNLEVELARQMEAGRVAAEQLGLVQSNESILDVIDQESIPAGGDDSNGDKMNGKDRDRARLLEEVRQGQFAKDALIEANLRLVVSIAKHYRLDLTAYDFLVQLAPDGFDFR